MLTTARQIEQTAIQPENRSAEDVRNRLLKSALIAFTRFGYGAATSRAIAEPVGMTPAMLNYYFGSKAKLFLELVEIAFDDVDREVRAHLEGATSFADRVRAIVRAHLRLGVEAPTTIDFLFSLTYGPSEGLPPVDLATKYRATAERMTAVFHEGLEGGALEPYDTNDAFELSDNLLALLSHALTRESRRRRTNANRPSLEEEFDAVEARVLRLFFRGVGKVKGLRLPGTVNRTDPTP